MATGGATRGNSAKSLLQIAWDYPVFRPSANAPSEATAVKVKQSLSFEEALRHIAGADPRPLLVLRECKTCNKTDNALLKPGAADSEKTILYARWFHCVKLPMDVIQADHPFNALFKDNDTPHFFVTTRDGSKLLPLESATSRTELWSSMSKVLGAAYKKDPSASLKDVAKELDQLDVLDVRLTNLEQQKNSLLENAGKLDPSKLKKIEADIAAARRELADAQRAIEKLTKAELKPAPKAGAPSSAGD